MNPTDKYEGAKGVPPGKYISGPKVDNQVGWYAVSVRGPVKENFVTLIKRQIHNDPFFGIYRIIDATAQTGEYVFIYMRNSQQVRDLLNSEKMGAATVKKEIGTSPAIPSKALDESEVEQFGDWMEKGDVERLKYVRKCFTGDCFKEEAQYAVRQIQEKGIKIVEYGNAVIRSLDIEKEGDENVWNFSIDVGFAYGFAPEMVIEQAFSGKEGFSLSNIELMMEPVSLTTGRSIRNLEEQPQYVKNEKIMQYADVVERVAEDFVKKRFQGQEVERVSEASTKQAIAEEMGMQEPQDVNVDSGSGGNIQEPFKEDATKERDPIKYTIDGYDLIFGAQGLIKIEVTISFDGTQEKTSVSLEKETLSELLTEEGYALILSDVKSELDEYFLSAPFIDQVAHERETQQEPVTDRITNGRFFLKIYNIDTEAILQANL